MCNSTIIQVNEVCKTYKIGNDVINALNKVTMHVNAGELLGILGPSGSGKSTLMNIIGCLDKMDSGDYYFDGVKINNYTKNQLAEIRNRKIGFIFQNFCLMSRLTAQENVELPLVYSGVSFNERREMSNRILKKVGLIERRNHKPTELSGGQQQRVAIARALINNPTVILADEPTGNLDSKNGHEIIDLFHQLNEEGNTIIVITHDQLLPKEFKRTISMFDGKIIM